VHLVVWTKFELEDDPATDDLTPWMRKEINHFVDETFRNRVPAQSVRDPPSKNLARLVIGLDWY